MCGMSSIQTKVPDDQLQLTDSLMPVFTLVPCLILGLVLGVIVAFIHQVEPPCLELRCHTDCATTQVQVPKWKEKSKCNPRAPPGLWGSCGDSGAYTDCLDRVKGRRSRASGIQVRQSAGDRDISQTTKWHRSRAVDDNRVGTARCFMCDCCQTQKKSRRLAKVSFTNGRLCRNVADLRVHRSQGLNAI
ncbi:hypothetical protein LSAT2_017622 [Lamellibrachia satsuma]|nr:hypothetical protein LSAT2_017622 [Lamellibrachia satsuma]